MDTASKIQALEKLVKDLRDEVAQLRAENEGLRAKVKRLEGQLAEGKQAEPPSFVKANRPKGEKGRRKKRAAQDNHGRRRMPPTRYEVHEIGSCPECGEQLGDGCRYYSREVIDIPPPQAVEVVEHQVEKGWCWRCRKWRVAEVNWAGIVMGSGRVGVRLTGLVAYMRAMLRVPIRTIRQYLATVHQVDLSVGEISGLCRRAVTHMARGSAALQAEARGSPVLHMDETGWREDGQNGYIWCLATDTPQPVRYFEYHRSRSGDVAMGMLDGYSGHLVTDFYAAYNKYQGPQQRCWVHLLRDLRALREAHPANGEVVAWALGVKQLYQEAKQQLEGGLSAAERQELAERLQRMTELFGLQYALAYDHPCCTLAKRLLRHQDELFQFVRHAHVPADNNLAERTLRPLVVQRKISGGSRSRQGSATRMQLASLFETWQARKLNPLLACWRQLGYEPVPATA
jgi:hypothetical protein